MLSSRFLITGLLGALSCGLWSAELTFLPSSGDWNTGSNWSTPQVPNASFTMRIPAGKTATISGESYAGGLVIESGGTLVLATGGTLGFVNGSTVIIDGTLQIQGSVAVSQTDIASPDSLAPVAATIFTVSGTGRIEIAAGKILTLQNGIALRNGGTMAFAANAGLTYENESLLSEFTSTGTINWIMDTGLATILNPAIVDLDGTLQGTLKTDYIPEVDDVCKLVDPLAGRTITDHEFDTVSVPTNLTNDSSNLGVFFSCTTSNLLNQTVTITNTTTANTRTYGDTLNLTATVSPDHAVTWSSSDTTKVTISGTVATMVGIGSGVVITATSAAYPTYRAGKANTTLGNIVPKAVTVTINGGTRSVGGANPTPTLTVNGLVTGDSEALLGTPTYSGAGVTADALTAAGTYGIDATFPSASGNYLVTVVPGTLTITAASTGGGSSASDSASSGGGGGCGAGGGLGLLAAGALFLRRRRG